MRNWEHDNPKIPLLGCGCEQHSARAVFDAFFASFVSFAGPEIRIADDEAGFRRRKAHTFSSVNS